MTSAHEQQNQRTQRTSGAQQDERLRGQPTREREDLQSRPSERPQTERTPRENADRTPDRSR